MGCSILGVGHLHPENREHLHIRGDRSDLVHDTIIVVRECQNCPSGRDVATTTEVKRKPRCRILPDLAHENCFHDFGLPQRRLQADGAMHPIWLGLLGARGGCQGHLDHKLIRTFSLTIELTIRR